MATTMRELLASTSGNRLEEAYFRLTDDAVDYSPPQDGDRGGR